MNRDDVISREDAINIASLHTLTIDETVKALEQLPSVTQKSECLKMQAKKQAMPMSCDDCCYEPNSPFCEMYRKDICEKKDERQTGKWIPVSERLPEDNQEVLVYCEHSYWIVTFYDYDGEVFWDDYGGDMYEEPIAWMPLPKPYEPQESEDKE